MEKLGNRVIEFNGAEYDVEIIGDKELDIEINDCIDILNSDELFDYLYENTKWMFDEINSDPYFEGKTITSGEDLKNSIEEISQIGYKRDVIYICGEFWCDPEHGFSISFPNGKFVKKGDAEEGSKFTVLGQFSDCL